jgi:hypothetical protein
MNCSILAISCVAVTFPFVVVVVGICNIASIKFTACAMKTYLRRKLSVITFVAGVPNIIIGQIMYVSLKLPDLIPVYGLIQI